MQMTSEERYYVKLKAAYLYYYDNLSQKEVADKLNISRPTLIKLLKEARQEGMVKIEIYDYRNYSNLIKIERQLCEKFGLKDAKLVDSFTDDINIIKDRISKTAAAYFNKIIRSGVCVGVGWSGILENMANYITPLKNITNAEFVTLLGGSGNLEFQINANLLNERIAKLYYNSSIHNIYAPIFTNDQILYNALMEDKSLKRVINKMRDLDIALIGVGGGDSSSTAMMTVSVSKDYVKEIHEENAVGNICARFFDIDGNICVRDLYDKTISIPLEILKKTPSIVAMASGQDRVKALIGAARGGYYNILITDENTAKAMLDFQ
jgi:deoxyribonucleoside regulator